MASRHYGNKKFGIRSNNMALWPKITEFLAQKSVFFLRYYHITQFFGLKQTRLNGIISSPYPQVTLDAFCFLVGVRSAAQQAVFGHPLTKMALFGLKMLFFLRYAHITHSFGLRQTRLNGIISSPYPQVTLDAFSFPVGAYSAARRVLFWPQLPKMALLGAKNSIF